MPTYLGPAAIFLDMPENFAQQRTPSIVHFQIKWSADGTNALPSQTFTIPVAAGTFVHEVCTFVSEAFTTGGANASLKVGDGADGNGYLNTTDTVLQTIDTATTSSRTAGEAFANGKYYSVDDTLDFVFVAAASAATAGCVKGFVVLSNVTLDGIEPAADGDPLPASAY
jgi:hypothetical protein